MFLQTKRLYLRNLMPEDESALLACRTDPECRRYQRWENPDRNGVQDLIRRFQASRFLSKEAEQHYAFCLTEGTLAGDLSCFFNEEDHCITLGITVVPEQQGRGIAREILEGVIPALRTHHPGLDLVALIHPENRASIRLFEGLGFWRECYAPSIDSLVYVMDAPR